MKHPKRAVVFLISAILVLILCGCFEKVSIAMSQDTMQVYVGETKKLEATVTPEKKELLWTSDANEIATVDANGNVTAVSEGSVIISAYVGNTRASCTVRVNPAGVRMNQSSLKIPVGNSSSLGVTTIPSGIKVVWSSSNPAIASVDANTGIVTAVATGTADITAAVGQTKAKCSITVTPNVYDLLKEQTVDNGVYENGSYHYTYLTNNYQGINYLHALMYNPVEKTVGVAIASSDAKASDALFYTFNEELDTPYFLAFFFFVKSSEISINIMGSFNPSDIGSTTGIINYDYYDGNPGTEDMFTDYIVGSVKLATDMLYGHFLAANDITLADLGFHY